MEPPDRTDPQSLRNFRTAERLVGRAFGEEDPGERAALARRALTADDSNPDAWGILAESEEDVEKSARLFGQALKRAEACLGPEALAATRGEQQGDPAIRVWEDPSGLSYLRARAGLGLRLALLRGRHEEEATGHLLGVLRLDPDDDLGVQHPALSFLLERADEGGDRAAREVLDAHPCDCAHHCYAEALLSFREIGGEDQRTLLSLAEAIAAGPLLPPFLYGELPVPAGLPPIDEMPPPGTLGEEEAALLFSATVAADLLPAWERTPGAQGWLGETCARLQASFDRLLSDPDAAGTLPETGVEVIAEMLGVDAGRAESRRQREETVVGFLFFREREEEDGPLARYKDGLQALLEDRVRKAGLDCRKGTAPFPCLSAPFGGQREGPFGDLPEASPLAYLAATGPESKVWDLAEALLRLRVVDFAIFAEDRRAAERFRALGAEVFEGSIDGFLSDPPPQ